MPVRDTAPAGAPCWVDLLTSDAERSRVVKARELSGVPHLQFWRNSVTGALEARPRTGTGIELNAILHAND